MEILPIHNPRSFISQVLVDEIGSISVSNVYLSFVLISIGIEFLGKCIDDETSDWNAGGKSEKHFNLAISKLMPKYRPYNLYKLLRCGLSHSLAPQEGLSLSENKNNTIHLSIKSDGTLILNIENFYNDFKDACKIVLNNIDKNVYKNKKIYQPFLVRKN
jgi:hypothetical protein